jgi:hypothetical protein
MSTRHALYLRMTKLAQVAGMVVSSRVYTTTSMAGCTVYTIASPHPPYTRAEGGWGEGCSIAMKNKVKLIR